jgi:hypothetical protein
MERHISSHDPQNAILKELLEKEAPKTGIQKNTLFLRVL